MGSLRFELKTSAMSRHIKKELNEYLDTIEISGITIGHKNEVKRALERYLGYVDYKIDKTKSLSYFKKLKDSCSISYYRKQLYQILKFLTYLGIKWAKDIKPPADPIYYPKRVSKEEINSTISFLRPHKHFRQMHAIIHLGASSGMRAEELYQLEPKDIDIEKRKVKINHNPSNGQTTKTKRSRVVFFNGEAQKSLSDYLDYFENNSSLKKLFSQTHIERTFRTAPIRIKDLRKYFSQEWDRKGGQTSIKKILMGHSLKGDVDLMHYNYQSEEDLKAIYDKVMNEGI